MGTKQETVSARIEPHYLYTPEELAPLIGLTRRQVIRLMDEGRIPFTLVGSHRGRRISGSQYMKWVESRAVEPETY